MRDFAQWREAFGKDAGHRAENGMRNYRIYRPVDNAHQVMLEVMRTQVWPDPAKAPAKTRQPRTTIIELVETHDY